jgi:hypothetical protein
MEMEVMQIAYIAGPFRAKDRTNGYNYYEQQKNIEAARDVGLAVCRAGAGDWYAFIPHMNTAHFQGAMPDEFWLEGDLEQLRRSDVVVLTPGWTHSTGAKREYDEACRLKIPTIRYDPQRGVDSLRKLLLAAHLTRRRFTSRGLFRRCFGRW